MVLLTCTLSACTHGQQAALPTEPVATRYTLMTIVWDGYTSAAKIWQHEQLLRMEVLSGRKSNTMLVDYRTAKAAVLVPATGQYQNFPLSQLNQSLPHFFDAKIKIEKTRLGEEPIDGQPAIKYQATVTGRNGQKHHGTLWLSQQHSNFPLKWLDAEKDISATWDNLELQSHPIDWFTIPLHYQKLNNPAVPPRHR